MHATIKRLDYTVYSMVYVRLNQATGEVIRGHCLCKAGKGGRCKHVAAMLSNYRLCTVGTARSPIIFDMNSGLTAMDCTP